MLEDVTRYSREVKREMAGTEDLFSGRQGLEQPSEIMREYTNYQASDSPPTPGLAGVGEGSLDGAEGDNNYITY